ncbi:unnamed protein product [Allacma fusca]|uniref:Uncharacterized protein n=1 Tax=Allacma fusca TaxID=39272 RepID=A0A8J2PNZ2_9HEXA|nr:unnamed protein product [Allacma fusca]
MMKILIFVILTIIAAVHGEDFVQNRWDQISDILKRSKSVLKCVNGDFVGMDELLTILEPVTSECLMDGSDSGLATTRCILEHLGIVDSDGFPHVRRFRRFISTIYSKQILHDVPQIQKELYRCGKEYAYGFADAVKNSHSYQADLENFIKCFEKKSQTSVQAIKEACRVDAEFEKTKGEFIQVRAKFFGNNSEDDATATD